MGQGEVGRWVHPKGTNSMAASGLSGKKDLGWYRVADFCPFLA